MARPAVPSARDRGGVRTPVDAFVLDRLRAAGRGFSAEADRSTLVRRLYLDLIGWTEENFGESVYSLSDASLGYLEIGKLAAALTEYADRPHDVTEYVDALMSAEMA